MWRQTAFIFRLAGQDLRGNAAIHAVAAAIISAAFLAVGVFLLIAVNLRALAAHWEKTIQVCIYLQDEATSAQKDQLLTRVRALPGVTGVSYLSREQALAEFKAALGRDQDLLTGLDENPLPASLIVSLSSPARHAEKVAAMAREVSAWPGVEEVDYGGSWLNNFSRAIQMVEAGVLVLGVLLLVAVVFIISNTIRLAMYSRQEEIGIMKLVGAGNLLIRLPFLLEGMVQGLTAAGLGALSLWLLFWLGLSGVSWPGIFAGFSPVFLSASLLGYLIGGGAVLGAAGSMARFSEFLRV